MFINLAKSETQKEEILNLLTTLQTDLAKDEVAQQKFFTVFSILKNLIKIVRENWLPLTWVPFSGD